MQCNKCGYNAPDNAMYCPNCSNNLTTQNDPVNQYGQQQNNYTPPQQPGGYGQPQQPYYNNPNNGYYPQGGQPQPGYNYDPYQQYGQPNMDPYASQLLNKFISDASSLKTLGIIAAVLMFEIGFIFSIIIWVRSGSIRVPNVMPTNPYDAARFEKAKKTSRQQKYCHSCPLSH